jgi:FemAB-related protein (PEP-CTERM system-associated)
VSTVRIVDDDERKHWDSFVEKDPRSTFCHRYGWKGIMRDLLGHEPLYLAAVDDADAWQGVLPLVRVRSVLGHYLISLPFLNDGGPLGDQRAQQKLVEHAVAEAANSGAGLLELRGRFDAPGPVSSTNRRITVQLELPDSKEEFWKQTLKPKLRSQIRRPSKEGMTFRSGSEEMDSYYEVFARNMRDLGTPVLPKAFFQRAAKEFGSSVVFAAVYTAGGRPVAGACCLVWRDEIEVTWASSLREFNQLAPNMMLYSRLMEDAIDRGLKIFNFGRCAPGGSTHRFKQQWGGNDVPLPWPSWSRKAGIGVPSADGRFYHLAVSAWQHLPLAVANRVGPKLARLLP